MAFTRIDPQPHEDAPRPDAIEWRAADFDLDSETDARVDGRLVIVPTGAFDMRSVRALEQARRLPAREHRAVHVVVDHEAAERLAKEWMRRDLSFPLTFVEEDSGVAETIARVVSNELASGFDEVIVLVGRLGMTGRVHRMLHDGTAEAIGRRAERIARVQVGLLTVAVP